MVNKVQKMKNCDKLCYFEDNFKPKDQLFQRIWNEDFGKILLDENFQTFLKTGKFAENNRMDEMLFYGATCFLYFIQENFTGPDSENPENFNFDLNFTEKNPISLLQVDGIDQIDPNFKDIELLCISKILFNELVEEQQDDLVHNVWYLRSLVVHQKVLEDSSNTIYENVLEVTNKLTEILKSLPKSRETLLLKLEVIQSLMTYKRINKIKTLLQEIKEEYNVEILEEGAMGMRTKFQQKALPQLHVSVKQDDNKFFLPPSETHSSTKLIELLKLDDEVRLEKIQFCSEGHNELQELDSIVQNFVLLSLKFLEMSQPKDNLADEEIKPYLRLILNQKNGPWIVRLNTLVTNIKLESTHRRTVERSLRQCEELVTVIKKADGNESKLQRLSQIFSNLLFPRSSIELQLANLLTSLGLIKSALDIYLKLEQWEEVINCYTILQLKHKAVEIINQELEKKPTVKLFCMLGDATDDVSYYEKAWEFSICTSGRAQRHWGNYYFARKEYAKAIDHLKKSLEINSLQEVTWLRLGYAALSLERWEEAANAYVRYTQIEPNGFESWNNLANCYIKMNDKKRAHKILQEALKCNFNNWKVWENFLLVSVDVGSFEDAINAYNRIIELKENEKFLDEEILKILTNAVGENRIDINGNPAGRLKKKMIELLAQLSVKYPTQGLTWELSARITEEPLLKAQKLQNAYRGHVSGSLAWSKNEQMSQRMLEICRELCETLLIASNKFEESDRMTIFSQLSSARLTGQGCTKAVSTENYESCVQLISGVKNLVEAVTARIKEIKP